MARRKAPAKKTATRRPSRGGGTSRAKPATTYTGSSKRVRDYLAKHPGATVAQARGHKPDEHRTRAARARAAGRLTESERASLKKFARRQARRNEGGPDGDALYKAMLERFNRKGGAAAFGRIKASVERHAKIRRRRHRVSKVGKGGKTVRVELAPYKSLWGDMDDFADRYDVPVEWLYYH